MRFSRLLPFAAAAVLAACNPQSADKSGAARMPIPQARTPAPTAAAADCPKTPACPPAKAKASKAGKAVAHRKARAHKRQRTYRRYEALAGGPPSGREYARVPHDYYDDGPAVTYRYGPAYPPAGRAEEGEEWGDERRYRRHHHDHGHDHGMDRRDERRWEGPPPAEDRYGPDRGSRWEGGSSYSERYSGRDDEPPRAPPRPEYSYGERRGFEARRYEERSESSSSHETHEARRSSEGACCRSEAAGFDQNGFLTWPGKVPARP